MKNRPHQGNVTRDIKIFILWDTGEHSQKEIASLITMQGYRCTSQTIRDALKRRVKYATFYVKHYPLVSSRFIPISHTVKK